MTETEDVAWQRRLRHASAEARRRRAVRADARRVRVERRRRGVATRLAWRQLRLDARAADRAPGPEPPARRR